MLLINCWEGAAVPEQEPAQWGRIRVGRSSTREGSGVSGCLQWRERTADAAKPRENAAGSGDSSF